MCRKLFADNTLIFSTIKKAETTVSDLNNDLKEINNYEFQWKMKDPTKAYTRNSFQLKDH